MALSKEEREILEAEKNKQLAIKQSAIEMLANKEKAAEDAAALDVVLKASFDAVGSNTIGAYDIELENINGRYFTNGEITEQDLIDVATQVIVTLPGPTQSLSRLAPVPPSNNINRIPEFDGGDISYSSNGELNHLNYIMGLFDEFKNGYSGSAIVVTTITAINPSSTFVDISYDMVTPSNGNTYVLISGPNVAVITITNVTDINTIAQTARVHFDFVHSGTLPSGLGFQTFGGFNNTQRTNKTGSPQALMDKLVDVLNDTVLTTITEINAQISAIDQNEDEYSIAELAAAKANAEGSLLYMTGYQLSLDISDSGIASFTIYANARIIELNNRIAEINNNFSNLPTNYYDKRYNLANLRAGYSVGSLVKYYAALKGTDLIEQMIIDADFAIAVIDDLLA